MDIEAFIERFEKGLEAMEPLPLDHARRRYDRLCASFAPPDPVGMTRIDDQVAGTKVRRFRPARSRSGTVIYLHGGGFTLGSLESHHGIAANLAERLGREVVSVDYPLAPEHRFDTMVVACQRVIDTVRPVGVMGDSAGARLALEVCHSSLSGLIYPPVNGLNLDTLGPDAPLLSRQNVLALAPLCPALSSATPTPRPRGPVEVLSVEHDPLTAPLTQEIARWRRAGGDIGDRVAPGMVHAALHAHDALWNMKHAWQDFCQACRRHLDEG